MASNETVINQHFIPRYYLRNFTDKKGRLYIRRRNNGDAFCTKPDKVCSQNNLYEIESSPDDPSHCKFIMTNTIENALGEIDSFLAERMRCLLDEIVANKIVHDLNYHKETVIKFIADLMARHPISLNEYYRLSDDFDLRLSDVTSLEERLGHPEYSENFFACLVRFAVRYLGVIGKHPTSPRAQIENDLSNFYIYFFKASTMGFVTTSLPLTIDYSGTDFISNIYIPLSSTVSAILKRYPSKSPSISNASGELVRKLNRMMLSRSQLWDCAISHNEELLTAVWNDYETHSWLPRH